MGLHPFWKAPAKKGASLRGGQASDDAAALTLGEVQRSGGRQAPPTCIREQGEDGSGGGVHAFALLPGFP